MRQAIALLALLGSIAFPARAVNESVQVSQASDRTILVSLSGAMYPCSYAFFGSPTVSTSAGNYDITSSLVALGCPSVPGASPSPYTVDTNIGLVPEGDHAVTWHFTGATSGTFSTSFSISGGMLASAPSLFVSTSPNPVQEGRSFEVTVAGSLMFNMGGSTPVASVTVDGTSISVALNRDCGFATCPAPVTGSQTFTVPALVAGTYTMAVYQGPLPTPSNSYAPSARYTFTVSPPNYQGLWWKAPAGSESGWGISIDHQGDILFAVWFTYDASGNAAWFVVPRAEKTGAGVYSGPMYQTKGPPFSSADWAAAAVTHSLVGTATFSFADSTNGTFAYTVNGVGGSKAITREIFSSPVAACTAPTS